MKVPDNRQEFRDLYNLLRSSIIRDIDLSHWYKYISIIVRENECLIDGYPEDCFFQIKFIQVKKITIHNCEDANQYENIFHLGEIEKLSKEFLDGKKTYYLLTSGTPSLEIYFDDIEIKFLGTFDMIEPIEPGNLFFSDKVKKQICAFDPQI
jgi:hypothetical protein